MSIQNFETGGKVTTRVQPTEEIRALLEDDKNVSYLVPQLLVDGGLGRVGAFSDVHVDFESAKVGDETVLDFLSVIKQLRR